MTSTPTRPRDKMAEEPQRRTEPRATTNIERRTLLLGRHMDLAAREETDRGYVLFLAAQMDSYLREILETFLIKRPAVKELFEGPYAPFGSLSGKTQAAYFMGLISASERDRIAATRKVRNVFAHDMEASFDHPEIRRICAKPPVLDGRQSDRDAFLHMAMNTALPLAYRSLSVKRRRRVELSDEDASRY